MPNLAVWQWLLGVMSALMIGVAKTGLPGSATLVAPLMVLAVGNARYAAAWTAPILSTGDIFAVIYWRRHADARLVLLRCESGKSPDLYWIPPVQQSVAHVRPVDGALSCVRRVHWFLAGSEVGSTDFRDADLGAHCDFFGLSLPVNRTDSSP